jgi:DNA-binding GntR family transcriptional regulator
MIQMSNTKQAAYENLRYRIISQQLAPGDQLKDKELMEHYGIGRTPLREVFLELQNEGLIKRVPRSGTWVAPIDLHFLKQITEIRIGLEGIAGEYAAERITVEQLDKLDSILKKAMTIEIEKNGDFEDLLKYESAFHDVVYAATGNPQLEKLLHNYQSVGARFWHYLVFSRDEMTEQFESHKQMLAALKEHKQSLCRSIAENHIRAYMGIINSKIEKSTRQNMQKR